MRRMHKKGQSIPTNHPPPPPFFSLTKNCFFTFSPLDYMEYIWSSKIVVSLPCVSIYLFPLSLSFHISVSFSNFIVISHSISLTLPLSKSLYSLSLILCSSLIPRHSRPSPHCCNRQLLGTLCMRKRENY